MGENYKISIIIPVYNSEKYISRCLDSVLKQKYTNYEIIVINDGSSDNSKEILNKYEKDNPKKIIHIEQTNCGVAKTRNYGIKIATGYWVTFIDNDDYIDENYLENLIKESNNKQYDAIISGYRRVNEIGKIIKIVSLKNTEWSKLMITAPWAKLYRRDYLLENDIEFLDLNIGEDVYFNLQAMLLSKNIKILNYVGYNWYFNTKSVSNTIQKDITNLQIYEFLNETYDILKRKQILQQNYEIVEMYFIRYIIWALEFATKKMNYKVISREYDKIFDWLYKRFPKYKKNKLIGLNKPKGESNKIRIFVWIFMIFHKINCGKLFIYMYNNL